MQQKLTFIQNGKQWLVIEQTRHSNSVRGYYEKIFIYLFILEKNRDLRFLSYLCFSPPDNTSAQSLSLSQPPSRDTTYSSLTIDIRFIKSWSVISRDHFLGKYFERYSDKSGNCFGYF